MILRNIIWMNKAYCRKLYTAKYQILIIRKPNSTLLRIHNLGMFPDQESNLQPFGVWDDTPVNWATWPGYTYFYV